MGGTDVIDSSVHHNGDRITGDILITLQGKLSHVRARIDFRQRIVLHALLTAAIGVPRHRADLPIPFAISSRSLSAGQESERQIVSSPDVMVSTTEESETSIRQDLSPSCVIVSVHSREPPRESKSSSGKAACARSMNRNS